MAEFAIGHHLAWMDVIFFVAAGVTTHRNQPSEKDASANFIGVVLLNVKLALKA